MEIKVEQRHIELGWRSDCEHCMIAEALNGLHNVGSLVVAGGLILTGPSKYSASAAITLPPEVWKKALAWDRGTDPEPFSFRLSAEVFMEAKPI